MTSSSQPSLSGPPGLLPDLSDVWPAALAMGLVTAVIGVVVLLWPRETLTVLSVLLGIQLVVFGLFRLVGAFSGRMSSSVLLGLVGVLGMAVGVVVLRHPFESIAVLATLLGVVWIVSGSIDLIDGLAGRWSGDRWVSLLSAAATIVAGIVVVSWPAPTLTVIAWTAGLYLVFVGVLISYGAFTIRQTHERNLA